MSTLRASNTAQHRNYPVLAVTMGDMNGIGPEVILKTLSRNSFPDAGILLFACREVMQFYAGLSNISPFWDETEGNAAVGGDTFPTSTDSLPVPDAGQVLLISPDTMAEKIRPGTVSATAGKLSMQAIAASVAACLSGSVDAMVTAPISKEAIHLAGYRVPGHTEFLAELTGTEHVGMMLANNVMRVGLATIHTPIKDVAGQLTSERIQHQLQLHHHALTHYFGIKDPRIAVLGLNPHAGDGGVLGNEEREIITPALDTMRKQGIRVDGPWPADGFFGSKSHEKYDLVFAMYHDQGLVPLKLSSFGEGINITIGLPVIRTSPDHGTAFSIAGKNNANPGSMKAALDLARTMALRRYLNSTESPDNPINHNYKSRDDSSVSMASAKTTSGGTTQTGIYDRLADIYDEIMNAVDYEDWTDYIDTIIRYHHPGATKLLELACGTGTMALEMELREAFDITATDISPRMIQVAREKGEQNSSNITWMVQDMCRLDLDDSFDVIYMVFDSLNYLQSEAEIMKLFESAGRHLKRDGIFIFDFTTPTYSPKIALLLNEMRDVNDSLRYSRTNDYDHNKCIHTNHFKVEQIDPKTGEVVDRFEEVHRQRIRTFQEMKNMVMKSDLRMLIAYEDFELEEATDKSDRITMILSHG